MNTIIELCSQEVGAIGFHFGSNGKSLAELCQELPLYSALQIFIGDPEVMFIKLSDDDKRRAKRRINRWKKNCQAVMQALNANFGAPKLFVHAAYCINLSNTSSSHKNSLKTHCRIAKEIGCDGVVVHMGKSLKSSISNAKKRFIDNIVEVASDENRVSETCPIIIETCCGAGSELFQHPHEINNLFETLLENDIETKIGLCIDSAHVWAAGYEPMEFIDQLSSEAKQLIKLIHYNDSKVAKGSNVDRHQTLFHGNIPPEQLISLAEWAMQRDISLVRE